MSEEKIMQCTLGKDSGNRVITVREIGYAIYAYYDFASLDIYDVPPNFVKNKERPRHLLLRAIREIGGFTLPVFEFKKVKKRGFWGWLGGHKIEYNKTGEVSGSWIRLDNGKTIYVQETLEELKNLIEGNAKVEAK